ncbi:phosphotransferase [Galbitalea sp. SE-J8]|uniref:maltokinase N-terminal cap-like domain-containing protein n=1 Tax=Galbitalea sp. SE-J8 TaxID=3054952 RepID=UPI00259D25ED|nr:phosphotransferase [Galbitalea sp. SE-J8]MDM4763050.1 phosphotransferase [Galbitalea sp. SE-J8]
MTLEAVLADWMPLQRWFAGKGHTPRLRVLDAIRGDERGVTTYLVMDDAGASPVLYQVPLVSAPSIEPGLEDAVAGAIDGRVLLDGPRHPSYALGLLRSMGVDTTRVTGSAIMRGEQSNTSIVYAENGASTIIAKVFRTLHHGENPDVTLQSALSAAGSPFVPRFLGEVAHDWPDVGRAEGRARGTLAFAQEFLAGVEDGWSIALRAATDDAPFVEQAHALGVATASVHATLARVMPTRSAGAADVAAMTDAWARRLAIACDEVAAIAVARERINAVYGRAAGAELPPLQRVHGDLHLGQVLRVPGRGWVLVDFEGEPLRPMSERGRPDLAVRDVAGMLRSFDYAAGAAARGGGERWAIVSRAAFLDGYASASRSDPEAGRALLEALELDKAVYEAIYEARNRPTWLAIPLRGVDAILARGVRAS